VFAIINVYLFAHSRFRKGVRVVREDDQDSTDLMKCIRSLQEKEEADGVDVGGPLLPLARTRFAAKPKNSIFLFLYRTSSFSFQTRYDVVLLGGFSGRLDQTVHLLSYLHKLRKSGRRLFVVTDENVGWVLDEVREELSLFSVAACPKYSTPRLMSFLG